MHSRPAYSYRDDPAVPVFADDQPIIVFDGECIFCSGWVNFVLRHDKQGRYRFLAAQSPLGEALYRHYGLDSRNYETNMLIDNGLAFLKSEGSLRMATGLGFPFSLAGVNEVFRTASSAAPSSSSWTFLITTASTILPFSLIMACT